MSCPALNAGGEPCAAPDNMVDSSGYCPAHRPGGAERLLAAGVKGGAATAAKLAGAGFSAGDLQPVTTLEEAKLALIQIRDAVLTRKITHNEGASASKSIAEWLKVETASQTQRLVNELTKELEAKSREIETLRQQLAGHRPRMRVAK